MNDDGPRLRPLEDYTTNQNADRRATYLAVASDTLIAICRIWPTLGRRARATTAPRSPPSTRPPADTASPRSLLRAPPTPTRGSANASPRRSPRWTRSALPSQFTALAVAAYNGMPVVRVGRGDPEVPMPSNPNDLTIEGSNLDATKARMLLRAAMPPAGPPAESPRPAQPDAAGARIVPSRHRPLPGDLRQALKGRHAPYPRKRHPYVVIPEPFAASPSMCTAASRTPPAPTTAA